MSSEPANFTTTHARAREEQESASTDEQPTFLRPDGKPLPELHHLSKNPRGKYVLKITIPAENPNHVGHRFTQQIRTVDPNEAMARRDIAMEVLHKCGMLNSVVMMDVE